MIAAALLLLVQPDDDSAQRNIDAASRAVGEAAAEAVAEQEMERQWAATLEVMESADADARANDPTSRIDLTATMRAEQSAWRSFVEAKCRFEAEWDGPVNGRDSVTSRCLADAFKQRTKRLADLEQEYDDERQ